MMNLFELQKAVNEAVIKVKAAKADLKETPIVIDSPGDDDGPELLDVESLSVEEFPDDEETYREHVRKGGQREFSIRISCYRS